MEFKYSNSMDASRKYFNGLEKKIEALGLSADWHYQSFCFENDADGLVLMSMDLDIVIWAYSPIWSELYRGNQIKILVGNREDLQSNNLPKQNFDDEVIFKLDSDSAINYVVKKIERKRQLVLGEQEVMYTDIVDNLILQTIIECGFEKNRKNLNVKVDFDECPYDITIKEIADKIAPIGKEGDYLEFLNEYFANKENLDKIVAALREDGRISTPQYDKYYTTNELYFEIYVEEGYLLNSVEEVVKNELHKKFEQVDLKDVRNIANNVERYTSKQISKFINEQKNQNPNNRVRV